MLKKSFFIVLLMMFVAGSSALANISGAIFTTESTCNGTNVNKFDLKTDVYLDGGPHKIGSAGLPDGYYYVQVTSPNGQLLGTTYGAADQTPVHVTGAKFDTCYQLWAILIKASDSTQGYDDTPNNGGVYKVWVTPADRFSPGSGNNGFINAWCKTDNFKVEEEGNTPSCTPSVITVRKFDDLNANGAKDENEPEIDWLMDISDPCGSPANQLAPFDILASLAGTWQICEQIQDNWMQTALIIDDIPSAPNSCAAVDINSECDEVHEVIFGNIQLGSIRACKFYDRNGNGVRDGNEPPVEGILFTLDGNDIQQTPIYIEQTTDESGCVVFDGLLPGSYTLCEVLPPDNWVATTDICKAVALLEGDNLSFEFGNVCVGIAAFGTKGYWHNKNGLDETVQADFNYLNSLAPWQAPSSYFGAGDEPINGEFANGKPIPAAKDASGKTILAAAGTAKAEQSYFLIDKNAGGDPREQLAQQLDAFIMNVRHRLGSPDAIIQKPDGTWVAASDLIGQAVNTWLSGTASNRTAMAQLLDTLNNSSNVLFIHNEPCPVIYP